MFYYFPLTSQGSLFFRPEQYLKTKMLALNNNALLHDIFVSVIAIQKPMLIAGF
jgi:hypothetical protein